MERQEFINIIDKHLAGQGSQIDVAGVLPKLLYAVADEWSEVGDLASLLTDHKSDIVAAINELADLVETPHFEISLTKSSAELKEVYDECAENLSLAKNIVFFNSEDNLFYRVNGYNMVNGVLKLHTIMGTVDMTISLASNGSLSVQS